jgi:hypothetical protein
MVRAVFYVAVALISVAGCGDSFSGAAVVDDAAAVDAAPSPPDAGPSAPDSMPAADVTGHDVSSEPDAVAPDVDGAMSDAGDVHANDAAGDVDAAACTPVTYTAPTTCACFFAGSCPVDGGPASGCIWAETPLTITGQPTCRGCGQIAWKPNPCGRCKETFSCACLDAYLDPGQRCCDGPGGPYLTDYACP